MMRLAIALCLVSAPADARQPVCALRADVMKLLASEGHAARWIGTVADKQVLEVFEAPSGKWAIMATTPNGVMCIVAAGHGFETLAEPAPLPGVPG